MHKFYIRNTVLLIFNFFSVKPQILCLVLKKSLSKYYILKLSSCHLNYMNLI